ncbi:MAG: omptin family outer membrane protease [Treponema sp.]|nr:omptin family outer membrane protease [Treponema sp.]
MKNITVLAVLVIIIGASTANISVFCQNNSRETEDYQQKINSKTQNVKQYDFSFAAQYGFVYGQASELVYKGNINNDLLSELLWDMKPVHYLGVQLDYNSKDLMSSPGFFASTSFKAGLPGDSGIMEDRDWINSSFPTHFSSHTNRTDDLFWIDIVLGASFPARQFYIKPFFSGSWMRFSFSGRDGNGIYPGSTVSFQGKEVIYYLQDWFLIGTGFSIGTKILSPFSFDLSFQMSPFTFCSATDEHLMTETTYRDLTAWGFYLEPGGNISVNMKYISFSFNLSYRFIGRTIGPSYRDKDNSGFFIQEGNAGAGLSLLDTRFLIKVHI